MIEEILIINTSSKHFCEWVRKSRSGYDQKTYPTENGYYQIGRAAYRNSFFETLRILQISGAYIYPKNAENQQSEGYIDLVEIFVQELNPQRIEITIRSCFSAVREFIDAFIEEIRHLWPNNEKNVSQNITGRMSEVLLEQKNMQLKLESIHQAIITDNLEQNETISLLKDLEKAILELLRVDLNHKDKERLSSVQKILKSDQNIKSKLVLTIPVIPIFAKFEFEIEQSIGVNINELVNRLFLKTQESSIPKNKLKEGNIGISNESTEKTEPGNLANKKFDDKKEKRNEKIWSIIIGILSIIVTIIIAIFSPRWEIYVNERVSRQKTQVAETQESNIRAGTPITSQPTYSIPTLTNTATQTFTHTMEFPEAIEPSATPSPSKVVQPTIVETIRDPDITAVPVVISSLDSSISIGVFQLKDSCWDKETKERKDTEINEQLMEYGFADITPIDVSSDYYTLIEYDILYLPHGWYCQFEEIQSRVVYLQEFVKDGGGLLIGNPDIYRETFEFEIFQTLFTYSSKPNPEDDFPPEIILHDPPRSIVENLSGSDFPLPENSIEPNTFNNLYAISKGSKSKDFSMMIFDRYGKGKVVLITGGEVSDSPHVLNEDMWRRIFYWLAQKIN